MRNSFRRIDCINSIVNNSYFSRLIICSQIFILQRKAYNTHIKEILMEMYYLSLVINNSILQKIINSLKWLPKQQFSVSSIFFLSLLIWSFKLNRVFSEVLLKQYTCCEGCILALFGSGGTETNFAGWLEKWTCMLKTFSWEHERIRLMYCWFWLLYQWHLVCFCFVWILLFLQSYTIQYSCTQACKAH